MPSRVDALALGAALALSLAGAPGVAQPPAPTGEEEIADADSQSVGYPDDGRLEHPFAVETGDRLVARREHRYGTRELVGLLHRAADHVARVAPGARLTVGNLSRETGGHLAPHESHQSGRDADVAFYVIDSNGRPVPEAMFLRIGEDGTGRRGSSRFYWDDARNWALLVAFVDDPMAEVQHVLIASHLRTRLLEYARRIEAPADQIRRVELVTDPIRGSESHDDHYHVRIFCSIGDRPHCLDRPPLHPWYYGTPSPRAVAAARVADLQRAAALRRSQEQARRGEVALARDRAIVEAQDEQRARELLQEPGRQEAAERRRAAALTRDERLAILEMRRLEAGLRREQALQALRERGRDAALAAERRRWERGERRRAERLRAAASRVEAEEQRRAAEQRAAQRRGAALLRRAEAQRAADARRAAELLRRGERLQRERSAAARRQTD